MPTERLIIIGAGGHAKVLVSAVKSMALPAAFLGMADDDLERDGQMFCGMPIVAPAVRALQTGDRFHVAIGGNHARERLFNAGMACGCMPFAVVHPGSHVSDDAVIGAAVFVAAGSVVAPAAEIGAGVIVNHGAIVDHDCVVGPFTHIGPNATLGGASVIGARVFIGAGANILPQVRLGDDVTVGAGAVVLSNVPAGATVVGVPARAK